VGGGWDWFGIVSIGLELYRLAIFVLMAVLKTLDGFARDMFVFII